MFRVCVCVCVREREREGERERERERERGRVQKEKELGPWVETIVVSWQEREIGDEEGIERK